MKSGQIFFLSRWGGRLPLSLGLRRRPPDGFSQTSTWMASTKVTGSLRLGWILSWNQKWLTRRQLNALVMDLWQTGSSEIWPNSEDMLLVLLLLHLLHVDGGRVRLGRDGGYRGLVVNVGDDVPEEECAVLVDRIKVRQSHHHQHQVPLVVDLLSWNQAYR